MARSRCATPTAEPPRLLFSAFEPSGDALAADVIEALRRRQPAPVVHALGGPRMAAAGAELLEETTGHGSMFLEPVVQAWAHRRRLAKLRRWLAGRRLDALVPVDSPAANWSVCRLVRRVKPEARIAHLVAPQLWAWAPWRIRRLRRLTDGVLCLLPFEEQWLANRGVPATFVGHPAFDAAVDAAGAAGAADLPAGRPRLGVLPGSRRGELERNWPTMLEAVRRLKQRLPGMAAAVAALDDRAAGMLRRAAGEAWPDGLALLPGRADAVMDWCDAALVVSGTVTLQLTARRRPMVVMYNMGRGTVQLARLIVRTRTFSLPNLVSEWAGLGRAVPELIPHYGQVAPVVERVEDLLGRPEALDRQRELLADVAARFAARRFAEAAPRALSEITRCR